MNKERLFWDKEYENYLRIWGDRPSELAIIVVKYLKSHQLEDKYLSVLDIGRGYGRDCLYLARYLNCCIFGIDTSQKAIDILKNSTVDPSTISGSFLEMKDWRRALPDSSSKVRTQGTYQSLKLRCLAAILSESRPGRYPGAVHVDVVQLIM